MTVPEPTAQSWEPYGVAVVITNRRGQVLMHLRDDFRDIAWPGYWSLISGLAERDETPAQAMARELREETGLTIPLSQWLESPAGPEGDRVVFFAGSWDGDPATLPLTEGVRLQFHSLPDLAEKRVPPFVTQALGQFFGLPDPAPP